MKSEHLISLLLFRVLFFFCVIYFYFSCAYLVTVQALAKMTHWSKHEKHAKYMIYMGPSADSNR